ncbi:MAG: hypothetical protein NTV01_05245 [Bacteroidia bacterium]|nr:hypothetical protein [Bacteroidia bacterium]
MKRSVVAAILTVFWFTLSGQGIFEPDTKTQESAVKSGINLSGYTRSAGFFGLIQNEDPALRSLYSETSLKLKAKTGSLGQAYSDIRFRAGTEYGSEFSIFDIREAYLDLFLGKVDLRIGKQISPWGRADGLNPTDNLTPSDFFVRSPENDDMRIGTFRIRGQYTPFNWIKLEADLVPWYTPSVYRFDLVGLPTFVSINSPLHPGFKWNKTSVAAKLDLVFSGIEGSFSWFSGYDPLPALKPGVLPAPPYTDFKLELLQVPFRQQTIGADFASIIFGTGIRGEIAYKIPEQGDTIDPMIPNSDIQWVISIDRELGPIRIIAGYIGKYVENFVPSDPPQSFDPAMISNPEVWHMLGPLLASQIGYYNRILYDQTNEWNHSFLFRPSVTLFNESLDVEITTLYNFTTKEYLLYPKATCHLTDGLEATAGYQYYDGQKYTRFSWIKNAFNGPFFEFRLTF